MRLNRKILDEGQVREFVTQCGEVECVEEFINTYDGEFVDKVQRSYEYACPMSRKVRRFLKVVH
jgi:hypothetical protein